MVQFYQFVLSECIVLDKFKKFVQISVNIGTILVRAKSQTDCRLATSHPSTYLIDLEIPTRISYLKRMLKTFPPTTLSHNGPTGIYSLLLISLIPSEFIVKLHKRTILLVILRDNSLPTAYPSYPDDLTSLACSNKSLIVF